MKVVFVVVAFNTFFLIIIYLCILPLREDLVGEQVIIGSLFVSCAWCFDDITLDEM